MLKELLSEQGASLIEMPMIDIKKAKISTRDEELLTHIDQYGWIVFTSTNGVVHFFDHLNDVIGSYKLGENTKIAVIGRETGSALHSFGYTPEYESIESTGEGFSMELKELFKMKNHKVLFPAGNLARNTIESNLSGIAEVFRINVYNTEMPEYINYKALNLIEEDNYEMIIFTSNSGLYNFCMIIKDKININININSLRIACIGSTTEKAALRYGINPLVIAKTMSSQGIADAIIEYYRQDNLLSPDT